MFFLVVYFFGFFFFLLPKEITQRNIDKDNSEKLLQIDPILFCAYINLFGEMFLSECNSLLQWCEDAAEGSH